MDKKLFADLVLITSVLAAAFCIARGFLLAQPELFTGALLVSFGGSLAYLLLQRKKPDDDDAME
ncbi:MAG: hypothetical protein ABWY08_14820 [Comamonas sp.]